MSPPVHKIVIVCAEPSGDMLASRLISAIREQHPNAEIAGIGGPLCQAQGMISWFDMDELSVMGLVEVLKHLPRLLSIRRALKQKIAEFAPDIFVGVDAPDFNLPIAKFAKGLSIPAVHYVSPTVWAWREKRIHKIKASTDHVLGLFPFEADVYQKHKHPYTFVGHPMADEIPLAPDTKVARHTLGMTDNETILALLPGSRRSEIEQMLPDFIQTFLLLKQRNKAIKAVIPAVNDARYAQINTLLSSLGSPEDIIVTKTDARTVMIASNFVLLTSGTATLEAMLCKKPMLSAYKMSGLTYRMMQRLYRPKYFSLPNILADRALFPELLQSDVLPERMADYIQAVISQTELEQDQTITVKGSVMTAVSEKILVEQQEAYRQIHLALKQNASEQACSVVLSRIQQA